MKLLLFGMFASGFLKPLSLRLVIISVLSLLTLSREFAAAAAPDTASFQASGIVIKSRT